MLNYPKVAFYVVDLFICELPSMSEEVYFNTFLLFCVKDATVCNAVQYLY